MNRIRPSPGYTIASVSKLTGISCHALRAWERRYAFPVPHRAASGHRRYDTEQVRNLELIAVLLRKGQPIGRVMADLRAGRLQSTAHVEEIPQRTDAVSTQTGDDPGLNHLLDLLQARDLGSAEASYTVMAGDAVGPIDLIRTVLEPGLTEVGERWFRGECSISQERCASGYLRGKLHGLIDIARRANKTPRRLALVGTVQGDRHEGGTLIFGLLLELAGWRALTLGVDLPVREYQEAANRWHPDAIALSFVLSRNINKRFGELARLRSEVPIFVGGRSILNYQGLARRYGLIPLPGSARAALPQFLAEAERNLPAPVARTPA